MTDRFLSRWARRKTAARGRSEVPVVAVAPELPKIVNERPEAPVEEDLAVASEAEAPIDAAPDDTDADPDALSREVAELGLPSLDSLGPGSDFKAFMQTHVPARIRTLALRKLWGSNPVLANLDGLIDYGEDFTDKALAVANLQTAYQVGKGYNFDPDPEEDLEVEEEAIAQTDVHEDPAKDPANPEDECEEQANEISNEEGQALESDGSPESATTSDGPSDEIDAGQVTKQPQTA